MDKVKQFAHFLINSSFRLKAGELLVITSDFDSHHDINEAIAQEAHQIGGEVMIIKTPPAEAVGLAADSVIPQPAFVDMMLNADCWLDTGSVPWLYSQAFETVMTQNERIRYMLISTIELDMLVEMFINNFSPALEKLCAELEAMVLAAQTITLTNALGADVTFSLNHDHLLVKDIGIAATPGFYTIPALFNIVPKFGSANGRMVFNSIIGADPWRTLEKPLSADIKDGKIVDISSEIQADADALRSWLAKWNEENIYQVAHVNFGLLVNVTELSDNPILAERMWGAFNWGFGSVSATDAPPDGQESQSHFDAVMLKPSVWIGDTQIMEEGEVIFGDLKKYADDIKKNTRRNDG